MLTNKKWINMVFENRNQHYGAFDLRTSSAGFQSKALATAVCFFSILMCALYLVQHMQTSHSKEDVFQLPASLLKEKELDKAKHLNKEQMIEKSIEVELPSVANWKIYADEEYDKVVREKNAETKLDEGIMMFAVDLKTGKNFVPEKAGTYKGGYDKLYTHILNQIKFEPDPETVYPHDDGSDEIDYEINTMIWIQCELNEDGALANATIFKGASDPKFNDRVLEAVKSSPDWIAAQHNGKKIKQTMIIPFHFNYMQPQIKYYN